MAHIGEIGKRITVKAVYKFSHEYVDYKFSYYGTTHFTHIFKCEDGSTIVWKSTNTVEYVNGDSFEFIPMGSTVELTGTIKEHGEYKGEPQTIVTRCKFKLIERAKTEWEIQQEKVADQMASIGENDLVWEMPYRQYKEHYSDCETVIGSFNRHEDSRGNPQGDPTIKVIIREGRLKKSGVRGQHYSGYQFTAEDGTVVTKRAVSEETALKRIRKEYPNIVNWECTKIFDYRNVHRIW